jgi:hypothetical protein
MTEFQLDYLNKHLPYRLNSLLAPDLITHRRGTNISGELKEKCYKDSLVLEPAFEISIIFGRSILHFLGITFDQKTNSLKTVAKYHDDDVSICTLFPDKSLCPLDDAIVTQNKEALCLIIKIANKSVAHLTTDVSNEEEHKLLENARKAIYQLVLKYIPEINTKAIWWYNQGCKEV